MGRSIADIRGLVLTHGDPDHVGFAERLRRDHGVPVHVHEADAAFARGEDKKSVRMGPMKIGPMLRFMWYAGRKGGLRTTPIKEVETFTDGETLQLPGSPRIIHIPGHTPGSVAIHVPSVDALFVGDALTTGHVLTGATGPAPAPFTMDPARRGSHSPGSRPSPPRGCFPAMAPHGAAARPRRSASTEPQPRPPDQTPSIEESTTLESFNRIFGVPKPVIAMLHLPALPGRPLHDRSSRRDRCSRGSRARPGGPPGCRGGRPALLQRGRPSLPARGGTRDQRGDGLDRRPAALRGARAVRREHPVGPDRVAGRRACHRCALHPRGPHRRLRERPGDDRAAHREHRGLSVRDRW